MILEYNEQDPASYNQLSQNIFNSFSIGALHITNMLNILLFCAKQIPAVSCRSAIIPQFSSPHGRHNSISVVCIINDFGASVTVLRPSINWSTQFLPELHARFQIHSVTRSVNTCKLLQSFSVTCRRAKLPSLTVSYWPSVCLPVYPISCTAAYCCPGDDAAGTVRRYPQHRFLLLPFHCAHADTAVVWDSWSDEAVATTALLAPVLSTRSILFTDVLSMMISNNNWSTWAATLRSSKCYSRKGAITKRGKLHGKRESEELR